MRHKPHPTLVIINGRFPCEAAFPVCPASHQNLDPTLTAVVACLIRFSYVRTSWMCASWEAVKQAQEVESKVLILELGKSLTGDEPGFVLLRGGLGRIVKYEKTNSMPESMLNSALASP